METREEKEVLSNQTVLTQIDLIKGAMFIAALTLISTVFVWKYGFFPELPHVVIFGLCMIMLAQFLSYMMSDEPDFLLTVYVANSAIAVIVFLSVYLPKEKYKISPIPALIAGVYMILVISKRLKDAHVSVLRMLPALVLEQGVLFAGYYLLYRQY